MQWSMPHRVLQVVAGLIGFVALSAFTLGMVNAPTRGRLPGERAVAGAPGTVPSVEATEATPLSQDRIQGAAPAELTPEEKAEQEASRLARGPTDVTAKVAAAPPAATAAPAVPTPTLQTVEPASPPAEEAPH